MAALMEGQPKSPRAPAESRAAILERLLARDGPALRRVAAANSANPADAEDALHDACVAFLRFYDGGDRGRETLAWFSVVIKRCAWTIGKRARRRRALQHVLSVEPGEPAKGEIVIADERAQTAELVERAEALERRLELLDRLSPDERTALILIGLGASYAEIGELRGWSYAKVNRCAAKGRARLRAFEDEAGERG